MRAIMFRLTTYNFAFASVLHICMLYKQLSPGEPFVQFASHLSMDLRGVSGDIEIPM